MIQQVRAKFNGQWYNLTYDTATDTWQGEITPESTSYLQSGHYFNIGIEAINETGAAASTDGTIFNDLQLIVNEREPPQLTLISPADGYVTTNQPQIIFYAEDESGGSGVDITSLVIAIDGVTVSGAQWQQITGGYRITYTPAFALSEGYHAVKISVSDFDLNTAQMDISYTVDTIPPMLTLREPNIRTVFDSPYVYLSGTASDVTEPVEVKVEINGSEFVKSIGLSGPYGWNVPLDVGANTIVITATDGVGWQTTKELFLIRLVTDRTQEDVDTLTTLLKKPRVLWTDSEFNEFLEARDKGSYNYTDINRVNLAMAHLENKFSEYGYGGAYIPGYGPWGKNDFPTWAAMSAYLENVHRMKDIQPVTVPLPDTMENLTFEGANNIEAVLVALDSFTPYLSNVFYAGEIYAGET